MKPEASKFDAGSPNDIFPMPDIRQKPKTSRLGQLEAKQALSRRRQETSGIILPHLQNLDKNRSQQDK